MSPVTTYYIYFSENVTQVFAKRLNEISLVNFSYQNQSMTAIENSLYFDFVRKDIVLNPTVPFSTLNHQSVFNGGVIFAGYHYRNDETLEVLLLFLLSHGLNLQKLDRVAIIYGFGDDYLDKFQEEFDSTISYILRRYDIVLDGFYREAHLFHVGLDLLSYYTNKVWLYLSDSMAVFDRYIPPRAHFNLVPSSDNQQRLVFYQELQKKLHYFSFKDIDRIASMLQHDYDQSLNGTAYIMKDEVFPIHHELVDQVFAFQSNGLKKTIDDTTKEEKDIKEFFVVHSFRSHRLQDEILSFIKRKRTKKFYVDDRIYLFDRYIVLVAELISQLNHSYRFKLLNFLTKNPEFHFQVYSGIYYVDPQVLRQFPDLEKPFLNSGEFRAYQAFVTKIS